MKRLLIAMSDRNKEVSEKIKTEYENHGYQVSVSQCDDREHIHTYVDRMNEETMFDDFIYIVKQPKELSILDEKFFDKISAIIDEDLGSAFLWMQETVRKLKQLRKPGRILLLNHISSVVPTQKYSYCSVGQAAMTNMSKVAGIEAVKRNDDIQINVLIVGWNKENMEEADFFRDMLQIHKDDPCPVLKMIAAEEIAECCYALNHLSGVTGTTLVLDNGYSVTRQIRKANFYKEQEKKNEAGNPGWICN